MTQRPTCSGCLYFQVKPANLCSGDCHFELKSSVVVTPQGATITAGWPTVQSDDVACAKFEEVGMGPLREVSRPLGSLGIQR